MTQNSKRKRIILDASNLSIHFEKFIRTGIQEVEYQTMLQLIQLRDQFPDLDLVLLPSIPKNLKGSSETLVPYFPNSVELLRVLENQVGLKGKDFWGASFSEANYHLSEDEFFRFLETADFIHFQGLVNIGPIARRLKNSRNNQPKLSMTIHDLVPVLYPEYCDGGIVRWFQGEYLPSVAQHLDQAICNSRNTALDLHSSPWAVGSKMKISILPLALDFEEPRNEIDLSRWGLQRSQFLVFVGSLEPRKNILALLEGFELYHQLYPDSELRLALVGGTGWKNEATDQRIQRSPVFSKIIRTGYLSDTELASLLKSSLASVMLSVYEGYGLPAAQAHALGVTVITNQGSSLVEASAGRGIYVNSDDPYSVCAGFTLAQERAKKKRSLPSKKDVDQSWRRYASELIRQILS